MRSIVIADEDTVLGFRFAGVEGHVVETPAEAQAALDQSIRLADVGLVILTEEMAADIREAVDEIRFRESLPLIVEIPGPAGPGKSRRTLLEVIHEAVGVSI